MKSHRRVQIILATALVGLALVGCSQQEPTPSVAPAADQPTTKPTPQATNPGASTTTTPPAADSSTTNQPSSPSTAPPATGQ
jgi:PBP1b-binding outer membrane lipoprotein LpoB